MKLSVIIPVYCVEATLDRCVESVISQDWDDLEVILVDDGSPDLCPQMCDEWAARNEQITVIHQANGGLSDARNAGIKVAQGDYLTFVDSDDFLAPNTYGPLMQVLARQTDTDILEYPIYEHYGTHRQHKRTFPAERSYDDMEEYWYQDAFCHSFACNKIYRAALFLQVRFPQGRLFEDAYTLPRLLQYAHVVKTANTGLYYYCSNNEGITETADGNALRMLLETHVEIIRNSHRQQPDFQVYYMHVLNIQMDVYELTGDEPILPQRTVHVANAQGVMKFKAIALNILGIKGLCKLNKAIHKIWRGR